MPRKITKTYYTCELCGSEYDNKESARACEKRGLFLPTFFEFDVVEVKQNNGKVQIGVVVKDYYEDSSRKAAHSDAGGYAVRFKAGETTYIFHPLSLSTLKFKGKNCPLCKSSNVSSIIQDHWVPSNKWAIPEIKNIEVSRCVSCGTRFFSDNQARTARKRIKNSLRVPIAKEPH
jgi:YgiT-type zinc finger domain-containing protein